MKQKRIATRIPGTGRAKQVVQKAFPGTGRAKQVVQKAFHFDI
jgi:hypothetical protein